MKKIAALIILIGAASFYFYSGNSEKIIDSPEQQDQVTSTADHDSRGAGMMAKKEEMAKKKLAMPTKPNLDKAVIPPFVPQNEDENSLDKISSIVSEAISNKDNSKALSDRLKEIGVKPITAFDKNSYTGNMTVIRTKENLPGTRYIHAQYFQNEAGVESLQHLSFEYRPGPNALPRAVSAVKKNLKIKIEPTTVKSDFVGWTLGNGFVTWCKVMNLEDLKNDPFNAYTPNDVGTVRCATELDIHEGDMDGHIEE